MKENSTSEIITVGKISGVPPYRLGRPYISPHDWFILCTAGESRSIVNGEEILIHEGDVVIMREGRSAQGLSVSDDFEAVVVTVSAQIMERLKSGAAISDNVYAGGCAIFEISADEMQHMLTLVSEMKAISEKSDEIIVTDAVSSLLMALYFAFIAGKKSIMHRGKEPLHKWVSEFFLLLRSNFRTEHSVDSYAERLGLTGNYLSSLVMKTTGHSAKWWIKGAIIFDAKALLNTSSDSIKEIAYSLGFSSPTTFSQFFKTETGLTPQEYRAQQG